MTFTLTLHPMLVGLLFTVVVGGAFVAAFLWVVRKSLGVQKDSGNQVPGWLTGLVERVVFTMFVAYEISGVGTAMIAWLALKFATNWNYGKPEDDQAAARRRVLAFSALLAGILSMLFATIGGRLAAGQSVWLVLKP